MNMKAFHYLERDTGQVIRIKGKQRPTKDQQKTVWKVWEYDCRVENWIQPPAGEITWTVLKYLLFLGATELQFEPTEEIKIT